MLKAIIDNKEIEDYLNKYSEEKNNIILKALKEFIKKRKLQNKAEQFESLINTNRKHIISVDINISDLSNEVNL